MRQLYIKGRLCQACPLNSNHGTPKAFTYVRGFRTFWDSIKAMNVLFARCHPTKDWTALAAEYKRATGWPIQLWAGDGNPTDDTLLDQAGFDALDRVDFYVDGHVTKLVNLTSTAGNKFVVVEADAEFETAIEAVALIWKTGDDFGAVAAEYKNVTGGVPLDMTDIEAMTPLGV